MYRIVNLICYCIKTLDSNKIMGKIRNNITNLEIIYLKVAVHCALHQNLMKGKGWGKVGERF